MTTTVAVCVGKAAVSSPNTTLNQSRRTSPKSLMMRTNGFRKSEAVTFCSGFFVANVANVAIVANVANFFQKV